MCRNIRPLYNFEPPATHDEVHDAALQFVRLLDSLVTNAPPKDREVEAEKRRARSAERYAA
jgi:hypothetical protein